MFNSFPGCSLICTIGTLKIDGKASEVVIDLRYLILAPHRTEIYQDKIMQIGVEHFKYGQVN